MNFFNAQGSAWQLEYQKAFKDETLKERSKRGGYDGGCLPRKGEKAAYAGRGGELEEDVDD